jgi:hypothetical protein
MGNGNRDSTLIAIQERKYESRVKTRLLFIHEAIVSHVHVCPSISLRGIMSLGPLRNDSFGVSSDYKGGRFALRSRRQEFVVVDSSHVAGRQFLLVRSITAALNIPLWDVISKEGVAIRAASGRPHVPVHQSAIGWHVSLLLGAVDQRHSTLIHHRVPFLLVPAFSLSFASNCMIPW